MINMAAASGNVSVLSDVHTLNYKVIKWSSYSSIYAPSNILIDCPIDQASRWSSESNSPPQYLVLELTSTSVFTTITFGKFEKTHVCNLKRFKIYAGPTLENMVEVLESGLQNDHIPEIFEVKTQTDSHYLPVKYIKIVPLQSWGTSFNFSIWYVRVTGVDNPSFIEGTVKRYNQHREYQAVRLCLKHFRQHNYLEAFEALRKKTKVSLEHPMLERLHQTLVHDGDYDRVEQLIDEASKDGLFSHFVNNQEYQSKWTKIEPVNRDGSDQQPGQRGGHQMVINPHTETLYLFGGWDGQYDLADFWSYHVPSQQWTCISSNTEEDGGPSPRSCHKMIIDCERRHLFVLGRYLDIPNRTESQLKSRFYVYDIDQDKWVIITEDTYSMGGPRLIFDHQMCMDTESQTIYVFGGKTQHVSDRTDYSSCSGLFSFHVPTNHWKRLRDDGVEMRARFGHSMMLNNRTRKLYVFAGQRGKDYFNDFLVYDVDNDTVQVLSGIERSNSNSDSEPPSGFTQRATLDAEQGVIHLLLSLNRQQKEKEKEKEKSQLKNVLWLYDLASGLWTCLAKTMSAADHAAGKMLSEGFPNEPVPRFAHQLVYDQIKKVHYMFGGNPGSQQRSLRLDDFWMLTLCRPSKDHFMRHCKYLIRKYRFRELAKENSVAALRYLQNDLYETIDPSNRKETAQFQKLTGTLFDDVQSTSGKDEQCPQYSNRSELYEILVEYFPPQMAQPKQNLVDLIK